MVVKYSPEPQKESDEGFTIDCSSVTIMDSSEEDDFDANLLEGNMGYELLPQQAPSVLNDRNGDSDSGNPFDNGHTESTQVNETSVDNGLDNSAVETPTVVPEYSNMASAELEINEEEVMRVMRNITLPPSSFPQWAASLSESQLTEFVLTRANRPNLQLSNERSTP